MSGRWVCRLCVMTVGIRGSDLPNWPALDDVEAQHRHIEEMHHIPVQREGETEAETMARFEAAYPEAGGPDCRCPKCVMRRRAETHQ